VRWHAGKWSSRHYCYPRGNDLAEIDEEGDTLEGPRSRSATFKAADHAGVVEVETLLARPVDLTVGLAEEHGVPLMDRELRRAYLNFERHLLLLVCLRLCVIARLSG
jgi:hypothetical protein